MGVLEKTTAAVFTAITAILIGTLPLVYVYRQTVAFNDAHTQLVAMVFMQFVVLAVVVMENLALRMGIAKEEEEEEEEGSEAGDGSETEEHVVDVPTVFESDLQRYSNYSAVQSGSGVQSTDVTGQWDPKWCGVDQGHMTKRNAEPLVCSIEEVTPQEEERAMANWNACSVPQQAPFEEECTCCADCPVQCSDVHDIVK